MTANYNIRLFVVIFFINIIISQGVLPLLAPLRMLSIFDPSAIKTILNPLIALLVILPFKGKILIPVSGFHYVIIFVGLQATLIGTSNIVATGEFRSYFSHLFQLASAYLLFGAGFYARGLLSEKLYKQVAWISLISYLLSTGVIIMLLGSGAVGRFYSVGYVLMPSIAYFSAYGPSTLLATVVLSVFFSNKRGVILSAALMIFLNYFTKRNKTVAEAFKKILIIGSLIGMSIFVVVFSSQINKAEVEGYSPIAKALSITLLRISDIFDNDNDKDLDVISAGRTVEIAAAMETLTPISVFLGNGAGWKIDLPTETEKAIQNIHFSPLSLICVFGLPFTIYIYMYIIGEIYLGLKRNDNKEYRMATLYVLGGAVHSLTAYSMFIDLLFFYFLGIMASSRISYSLNKNKI